MLERDRRSEDLSFPARPTRYHSRSEDALAFLFEKYIPNWKPIIGKTCQIPIGLKTIDFQINDELLEYHPILINRELKSSKANQIFRAMYARATKWERSQLCELLTHELAAQYERARQEIINNSEYKGKTLIVCCSVFDVYRDIIIRYAKDPPTFTNFKAEFYNTVKKRR
jgi:hypothetical protein